jgi:SEC-C motif-containing protein
MALAYPPFKSCPCGSGRSYANCCGPAHDGSRPAATPEALMRARYSAYALRDVSFVLGTWHPDTRPAALHLEDGTKYTGLTIHAAQGHVVDFTATLRVRGGETVRVHERSAFAQVAGTWVYVDEVTPPTVE